MIGLKFCGPFKNASGYAEFSRMFISALVKYSAGEIDLTLQSVLFEKMQPDIGKHQQVISKLENRSIDYPIKVINAIPDALPTLFERGKKNVCFTMFETSRIPESWVDCLNHLADAVFVPCAWNREIFISSGVKTPIYVVSPGINPDDYKGDLSPQKFLGLPDNTITFYNIAQWTARKGLEGLIKSYLAAFDGVEDVCLVLKTYGKDYTEAQQERIRSIIKHVKSNVTLRKPPKILLIGHMLTNDQISSLHKECDVYIAPHKAEAWSMPAMEAMANGKPVIATGYSGNTEFMNNQNSFLLPYQMTIVSDMPWSPYYESDMEWGDPNLVVLKEYMRKAYLQIKMSRQENTRDCELYKRASQGQQDVLQKFTWECSAKSFTKAIKEIVNG